MVVNEPAPQVAAYFSPYGGCTDAIVKELDAAKESVLVRPCSFSSTFFFQNAGIPTLSDNQHAIAHHKVMVIAGRRQGV